MCLQPRAACNSNEAEAEWCPRGAAQEKIHCGGRPSLATVDEIDQVRSHAKEGVGFQVVGRDLHDVPRQILGVWPDWAWNGRRSLETARKSMLFDARTISTISCNYDTYVHKHEVTLA